MGEEENGKMEERGGRICRPPPHSNDLGYINLVSEEQEVI